MSYERYEISDSPEWNKCLNLLLDDDYSEIEVNGPDGWFTKRKGKRIPIEGLNLGTLERYYEGIKKGLVPFVHSPWPFKENSYIYEGPLRYKVDEGTPDEKYIRGRCHIVMPPAADYPQITIAKKSTALPSLEAIASNGSMSTEMMTFLLAAIKGNLTIAISGGTGAGKDSHKTSVIPTPRGMRTLDEIEVGDVVFDENGQQTTVLKKYAPLDPKHYELTFSNGEKVKAGMGHLWKVQLLNEKKKYGAKTTPLFTAAVEKRLRKELAGEDEYLFLKDVYSLVGPEAKETPVFMTVKGFGFKSNDFFAFNKADAISKISSTKIYGKEKKAAMLRAVEAHEGSTLTLGEFRSYVNDRAVFRRLLPEAPKGAALVFNKKEVINELLKENELRKQSRALRNAAAIEAQRPVALMTTEELFTKGVLNEKGRLNFAVERLSSPVEYEEKELPIDPYTLGAWLGDGSSSAPKICGINEEVAQKISTVYKLTRDRVDHKPGRLPIHDWTFRELAPLLKAMELKGNKHIPDVYTLASTKQRQELLAGLVDTDGSVSARSGFVEIGMTNRSIVESARQIALSLGWHATKVNKKPSAYTTADGERVPCKDSYNFSFVPNSLDELPLQVQRKKKKLEERFNRSPQQGSRHLRTYIKDIQPIEDNPEDYFCLEVDSPSHMFLISESFIPTHNTTILEAMAKNFAMESRIGVAEDSPELYLSQPNVTYLHSVPWSPGMNPNDVATLSWAVAQFQRMRTDKIIIGETRGPEFADFLVAANSGMDGSLTTLHANNPVQCLDKMTNFALRATHSPIRSINTDIANSIDLIIQLLYTADGRYRTSEICEITTTLSNDESARITTNTLYKWDSKTDIFEKKAMMSDFLRNRLSNNGIDVSPFLQSQIGAKASGHSNNEVADSMLETAGAHSRESLTTIADPPRGLPTVPRRHL